MINRLFLLICIFLFAIGCCGELKNENANLKSEVESANSELLLLRNELKELKETDNYYYQKGVSARSDSKFKESNKYFNELLDRFPQSDLRANAKNIVNKNNNDIMVHLYKKTKAQNESGSYKVSNETANEFLEKYPKSKLAYKVKNIRTSNRKGIKKQEEAEKRKGCDLELIDWNWKKTAYGSFIEVSGRVKNISNKSIENVAVVSSFYNSGGTFITSDTTLIEYNPIMPSQISPFKAMVQYNPAMEKASITFKDLLGGQIRCYTK